MKDGYKKRCKREYDELCERIDKLMDMLGNWVDGELDFTPSCPMYLLERQLNAMIEYKQVLEARNYIEKMWEE